MVGLLGPEARCRNCTFWAPWGDEGHCLANFSTTYGPDYNLRFLDPAGTCDWDGKGTMTSVMKWEEFRALKGTNS